MSEIRAFFEPIWDLLKMFSIDEGSDPSSLPTLAELNRALALRKRLIVTGGGHPLKCAPQISRRTLQDEPAGLEGLYEPRIFLKGELMTRMKNWHDFFNFCIWFTYPLTKNEMNRKHFWAFDETQSGFPWTKSKQNRTRLQDALTLFDEGGAVFVCSNDELIEHIRQKNWKAAFCQHRDWFKQSSKLFIIGHAVYENLFTGHRGLHTSTLIIPTSSSFFQLPLESQLENVDYLASQRLKDISDPSAFVPLPILALPGYYQGNERPSFYENTQYLRPQTTTFQ